MTTEEKRLLLAKAVAIRKAKGEKKGNDRIEALGKSRYGLSSVQRGIWLDCQLDPDSAVYNIPFACKIKGSVDIEALKESLKRIIARHDMWRTVFRLEDGDVIQEIMPEAELDFTYIDLQGTEATDEKVAVEAKEFVTKRIDLERGPLVRFALYRTYQDTYYFILSGHHIAYDGSSENIFCRELTREYSAVINGTESGIEAPGISYGDYAEHSLEESGSESFGAQVEYWKKELDGIEPVEFPTDYARPAIRLDKGGMIYFDIDEKTGRMVRKYAASHSSTVNVVLFAAMSCLLRSYSRSDSVVMGTTVTNRDNEQLENMIGCFINNLVITAEITAGMSFDDVAGRVREKLFGAYGNKDVPLEKLVEVINPPRDLSRTPFYEVGFNYNPRSRMDLSLEGCECEEFRLGDHLSLTDVNFQIHDDGNSLCGFVEYNSSIYSRETVRGILEHYKVLLANLMERPSEKIGDIGFLSQEERELVLGRFNDTAAEYPREKTIAELFEEQAERTPDNVAVVFKGEELTYRELNGRANSLAHRLRELGVGPDDFVAVIAERGLEMIEGILGVIKAGGAYVPIDPTYPEERIRYMLEDSRPKAVLTYMAETEIESEIPVIDLADGRVFEGAPENPERVNRPEDLIYCIYTSGTTGKPKGVLIEHRNLANFISINEKNMFQSAVKEECDFIYSSNKIIFDIIMLDIFIPLFNGVGIILADNEWLQASKNDMDTIRKSGKVGLITTPTKLRSCISEGNSELLKNISFYMIGAESLQPELVDSVRKINSGATVFNAYGPTEATCAVTFFRCDGQGTKISIGSPISNTQIYIMQGSTACGIGIPGELCIAGDGLARGYLNRPELTAEKFAPNLFGGGRLYHTGDLARWLPDGNIEYLGRIDEQVKIRGFRIELGEIESRLRELDEVKDCAVIAREDASGEKAIYAYVVGDGEISVSRVRESLGKVLPEYMVPQYMMQIENVPITKNGKLDKRSLPEIEASAVREYVAPRNSTEETICRVFGEVLNVAQVGVKDSFFELGGHSLRATRLVNRIEAETGCRIALKQVFGSPTPEKLAELVSGSKAEEYAPIPRAEEKEYYPMSSGQRRMFLLHQIENGSITYNMPQAFGFSGRLDYNRVLRSFKETIERHEVLRTRLIVHNDELVQQICKSFTVDVREIDLIGKSNDEIEDEFNSFVKPFDFSCPPLVRMALVHKDDGDVLFIDMHHIVSDGNSMSIFLRDFSLYYNKGAFDVPAMQYRDYSEWCRDVDYSKQERYWKEQLQCVPVLDMPLDFPRPKEQSFAGNAIFGTINKDLQCKIQRLCKKLGITEYMLLLSGIMITLSKYSNQDDIVIGSPIAGRTKVAMDTMMGVFINTLVMRGRPSAEKTVSEFLFEMKDTSLKAYENQEYPFERLVETIDVERNISRNPLFDVLFTYQNLEKNDFQLDGINGIFLPYGQHKTAKMDLNFSIGSEDDGYYISLEYCTAIYKESTVASLLERFKHVVEQIVDRPDMKISDIEIVSEEEKRKFLESPKEKSKSDETAACVHRLFEVQALTTPNDIAAISEGKSITYKELNARSNQLSRYLCNEGLVSGDVVSLYFEKSIDTLTAVFGVLKNGCTYVPLDTNYPKERISSMLVLSESKAILTLSKNKGELSDITNVKIIAIDELAEEIDGYSKENNSLAVDPEQIMYIIFTSGSTGTPKGVAVRHRNYYYYLKGIINSLNINEPLSFALVSTFAADLGSTNIFVPLVTGGKVHMISYECATDPEELASYFRNNEIEAMKLVPSHFEALQVLEHPEEIIPRKKIIFAGEACKYDNVAKVRELRPECEIYNNYGPTETTVSVLSYRVPDDIEVNSAIVPLGRSIDGVRAYILDANKKLVPEGVYGELYIGGPTVSSGYINDSLQNEKSFIKNPFDDKDHYPLYKTGDKVRWLPNGVIDILGRMDRQIKIRGYRIDPEGIEEIINGYSRVQNSVVTQKTDRNNDSRLVAYVVMRDKDSDSDLQSIKAHLKTVVPDYMVPSVWIQIESLPITENGKLDYAGLPEINNTDMNQGEEHILPRTEAEKRVVEAFKSILGVEEVGIDDSFFDLGGESFKAIKTVKKIDPSLKVIQLFKNPTPRQLALCLGASDHESAEEYVYRLTKDDDKQRKVNLICVPYGGGQAIAFQPLADCLPEDYALYSVQVPGRDIKGGDSEPMPLYDLARACVDEIKSKVNGPIAILGHCIGGALAMQIALLLEEEKLSLIGVFEEANFPTPRLPGRIFELWNRIFPAERFVANRLLKEALKAIGSLDDGDSEEQGILLKNMRADAREAEDFYTRILNYTPDFKKLSVPICCIMGERDRTTTFYQERYREWEDFSDNVSLKEIPEAGHFFQKHQPGILAKCIVDQLEDWRKEKTEELEQKPHKEADAKADIKNNWVKPSLKIMILVAIGQIISLLGSTMSSYALGIWVMGESINITPFMNISIIVLLPALFAAPFAGPLVDRVDRRKVMIISDCIAATGTILVGIMLFTGNVNIWFIYLSAMLSSFAGAFQRPAYLAAIAQITPKRYLDRVNGFVQLGEAGGTLIAPMLAGVLLMTIDIKGILIIDLATFIISTTVLLLVRFPNSMFQKQEESFAKEFVGGWKFIAKRKSMRLMVIFFLLVNFFMAAATFLYEPILLNFADAATLGMVLAAQSFGMIVAGLVISVWGGCESRAKGMVGFVILAGISAVLFGIRPSAQLTAVAMFINGMSVTLVNTHWQILIQSKVGMELQGRVFSINIMLVSLFSPIAVYIAGVLSKSCFSPLMAEDRPANRFLQAIVGSGSGRGMALLCVILGLLQILWGIIGMQWKSLVNMDTILPDATPGAVISGDKDKLQNAMDNSLNETQKH